MSELLGSLPGWTLLIPFSIMGVAFRAKWLAMISGIIIALGVLVILAEAYNPSGPGTYGFYGALVFPVISLAALFVMWLSAGASAVFRRIGSRRPPEPIEFDS